jgi:hypothetical protein
VHLDAVRRKSQTKSQPEGGTGLAWGEAMAVFLPRRVRSVRRLPKLPVEAGEHDDFARQIAMAETPTQPWRRRNAWLGVLSLVLLGAVVVVTCVHQRTAWVPVPDDHVLLPSH